MKYLLLALFSLFFVMSAARAQTRRTFRRVDTMTFSFPDCKTTILKLQDPEKNKHPGRANFRHFVVLDERQDTARMGMFSNGTTFSNQARQLIFDRSASDEFSDYLNARFTDPAASSTALVVIRFLWISDVVYIPHNTWVDPDIVRHAKVMIRLKAEVYAEANGVYTPLFRFDSTRLSPTNFHRVVGVEFAGILNDLADSAAIETEKKDLSVRHISMEDIRHFNQSRIDQSFLRDSTTLVAGVYKDFEEFRNNTPSIQDFEIEKHIRYLSLYLKDKDGKTSFYSHQVWGYCDGKTVYVMAEGLLAPIWKEGRAYYLLIPQIMENADPSLGVGELLGMSPPIIKHILTIDMDSGKIY